MAVIRSFQGQVLGRGQRHTTDVDCIYFDFLDGGGNRILQLSTLGSDLRVSRPKVSQTIQIDRESAIRLKEILSEAFDI
jgi:hypothetical protein